MTLPSIQELTQDDKLAPVNDQFNELLSQNPPQTWIKEHPYIKDHKYIPIDKVEYLLRRIFREYRIEITGQGTAFNGVWVSVRVHFKNPISSEWSYHDGIGAYQLQTKQGASPADLANINNGALSMAFPIAKTLAVKDACDHFGRLFGSDLNRKDVIDFNEDPTGIIVQIPLELEAAISEADKDNLKAIWDSNPGLRSNPKFLRLMTKRKQELA